LPPNDIARLDITPAPLELLADHAEEWGFGQRG